MPHPFAGTDATSHRQQLDNADRAGSTGTRTSAAGALWPIVRAVMAPILALLLLTSAGCSTVSEPIATVSDVDIDRFMGDWYVIAHIPPFLTDDAYNAVERYRRGDDNRVEVLYTWYSGGFDGELKQTTPTGFIDKDDPGQWGMRLIWPFKSDYRIAYLHPDYETTIIARNKRDFVWVMAREPIVPESTFAALREEVREMGYDMEEYRRVPQEPLSERPTPQVAQQWEEHTD